MFKWGVTSADRAAATKGEGPAVLVDSKAAAAEFMAMTLFVIIGCGTACGHGASDAATRAVVAFAFGSGILTLAYTFGHHSGAQINCAVTWSLVLGGELPWYQGLANTVAQLAGSLAGASFLAALFPCDQDMTTNLGTNIVNPEYGPGNAMFAEIIGTFLLCIVVWEVALSPLSTVGRNAPIAIGFAVFLAHLFLLPIDGCSINPTRSFGPAIVGTIRACRGYADSGIADLRIMFLGPMVGGALAAIAKTNYMPQRAAPAKAGAEECEEEEEVKDKDGRAERRYESRLRSAGEADPGSVVVNVGEPSATTYGHGHGSEGVVRPKGHRGQARQVRKANVTKCLKCMPTFS